MPIIYWIFALDMGSNTATLHNITDKTSLLSSFIFLTALTNVKVSDVFFKHRFQLEECLEIGNNRINSVVKPTVRIPK